ncbi:hypothetical protein N431DRAFT_425485 [Stipitochalara longipes BDJ]|nr:hypothetical protein N431DRAFT_425485 [Stipitochalara longipes BDJ]
MDSNIGKNPAPVPDPAPRSMARPSVGSGASQERNYTPSPIPSSQFRKHSLDNMLQSPEGIATKRVKSSDPRVSIPEDTVRPPNTGETPPVVWKALHDYSRLVHGQEYAHAELARVGSDAVGNESRELVEAPDRLGTTTSEKQNDGQLETREPAGNEQNFSNYPLQAVQLDENTEHGRMEPAKALVEDRGNDRSSIARVTDSSAQKSPPEGSTKNAISASLQRGTIQKLEYPVALVTGGKAAHVATVDGEPWIYFERIDGEATRFSVVFMLRHMNTGMPIWATRFPEYSQRLQALEAKLPADEKLIREQDELIANKRSNIESLEHKYDELIQMMPEPQKEELVLVRDRTRIAVQQEVDQLSRRREGLFNALQYDKAKIGQFKVEMIELKRIIPELVRNLAELADRLP